jgi:hypothetical protein
MLEDAFVVRDQAALARLFEDRGVLAAGGEAHGGGEIERLAMTMWEREVTYLADPRRIVQARDTALVIARRSVSVARRAGDGRWRFAISLLDPRPTTERETP